MTHLALLIATMNQCTANRLTLKRMRDAQTVISPKQKALVAKIILAKTSTVARPTMMLLIPTCKKS
jgi:hypothetical protein